MLHHSYCATVITNHSISSSPHIDYSQSFPISIQQQSQQHSPLELAFSHSSLPQFVSSAFLLSNHHMVHTVEIGDSGRSSSSSSSSDNDNRGNGGGENQDNNDSEKLQDPSIIRLNLECNDNELIHYQRNESLQQSIQHVVQENRRIQQLIGWNRMIMNILIQQRGSSFPPQQMPQNTSLSQPAPRPRFLMNSTHQSAANVMYYPQMNSMPSSIMMQPALSYHNGSNLLPKQAQQIPLSTSHIYLTPANNHLEVQELTDTPPTASSTGNRNLAFHNQRNNHPQ